MMSWTLLEEAKKIISINSVTYESDRELVDYICTLLKPLDLHVELHKHELYQKEQFNLIAKKGPEEGDGLLFNTHLDTVSPGDFSLWDKTGGNPFRATIDDNKIYGLGAADVKLDILCKIKALEKFKGVEFKYPFILVGTFGEESGLKGAEKLVEEKKIKARYVVVGEPSNLSIVHAHKGHLVLEVTLRDKDAKEIPPHETISRIDFVGVPAHSSTPHLGVNAIQKGFDFLRKHKGECQLIGFQGGELVNVIPDRASLWFKASQSLLSQAEGEPIIVEKTNGKGCMFGPEFLNCLEDLRDLWKKLSNEFKRTPMPEFDPPINLLNIGTLSTDENRLSMKVGIRTLPSLDSKEIVERIGKQLDQLLTKYPNIQGGLTIVRESLPMKTELDSTIVTEARKILRDMGLQDTVVTKATSTEASIYSRLGAQTIVWGPGISVGNVHKPNEYNYIHHLDHAVRFYEKLIELFCVRGLK